MTNNYEYMFFKKLISNLKIVFCATTVTATATVSQIVPQIVPSPISQEPYVRLDFARCQKKCLDEPDSTVPITLGSAPPLVVKIDIKKII